MTHRFLQYTTLWLSLAGGLMIGPAQATEVGDTLPELVLEDQYGAEHSLNDEIRRVYFNADRDGDKLLEAAMEGLDQSTLEQQRAAVIANISAAPGFVRRIIKSGLKDRPYLTWVDSRNRTRGVLPARGDQVSVLDLQDRRITRIRFLDSSEPLRAALQEATPTPTATPAAPEQPDPSPSPLPD